MKKGKSVSDHVPNLKEFSAFALRSCYAWKQSYLTDSLGIKKTPIETDICICASCKSRVYRELGGNCAALEYKKETNNGD